MFTLYAPLYREGYARSLEMKGVEWNGDNKVEHMWEQVKRAMEDFQEKCVAQ